MAQEHVDSPTAIPAVPSVPTAEGEKPGAQPDSRVFGVLPNYRTADGTVEFHPISAHRKIYIATKDSFDYPNYYLALFFSGIYQLENQNPSFGQGVKGYAHRYVTAYGDQVIGNMLTEGFLPSAFHQDPRYFRRVEGSVSRRTFYALSRVLVCRTDRGNWAFNSSEVLGNGIMASIGNAYYPDNRSFSDTMQRMGTAIATDAISNVLKEFWPDIKKKISHRHTAGTLYSASEVNTLR